MPLKMFNNQGQKGYLTSCMAPHSPFKNGREEGGPCRKSKIQYCMLCNLSTYMSAKVTHTFKDCLTRQVIEAVHIKRSDYKVLNSKSEWHQPSLFSVQSEVIRG